MLYEVFIFALEEGNRGRDHSCFRFIDTVRADMKDRAIIGVRKPEDFWSALSEMATECGGGGRW